MNILRLIKLALKAIGRNKFRTFLTMLGIIIGVASVITMLAIGQGSQKSIEEQISNMGSNMISIRAGADRHGPARGAAGSMETLTIKDVQAVRENCKYITAVSPEVRGSGQAIYGSMNWSTSLYGVGTEYLDIRKLSVVTGDMFTENDVARASKVCLLGKTVVENLFDGNEDPVGKMIRYNKVPFKILGILSGKGESTFGHDQDDLIIAPYSTVQKRILAISHFRSIYTSAVSEELADEAKAELEQVLREQHRLRDDEENDFRVRSQQELITTVSSTSKLLTVLLASIAGISLIVGGIGIMNIMYVSVTERTREIGLRMAVGARGLDIMYQFLIEAVIISISGGIIGIILGLSSTAVITRVLSWPTSVSVYSMVLAFVVCVLTGIFFGWYPAVKASRLDPIEALRYE